MLVQATSISHLFFFNGLLVGFSAVAFDNTESLQRCLEMGRVFILASVDSEFEKEMATHSSILASKIPWTEEPGGLQFMGS